MNHTSSSSTPLLRVRNAHYAVDHPREGSTVHVEVFNDLSLDVFPGEIIDITGPSGSGKSSFLETIAQLRPHGTATLELDGVAASTMSPQMWRRQVAYVHQKAILTGNTVREALLMPWSLQIAHHNGATRPTDQQLREGLDALLLPDVELERETASLSGGQLARVSLLRTLLTRPRVLLADEIDAALDDESAHAEGEYVARLAADFGLSALRVRHRAPDGFASRTLLLDSTGLHVMPVHDSTSEE